MPVVLVVTVVTVVGVSGEYLVDILDVVFLLMCALFCPDFYLFIYFK